MLLKPPVTGAISIYTSLLSKESLRGGLPVICKKISHFPKKGESKLK